MADRPFPIVGPGRSGPPGPIDRIARAEGLRPNDAVEPYSDDGPDVQPAPRPFAPGGLAADLDDALGSVALPRMMELAEALTASRHAATLAREVDPGLGDVIAAVLDDEEAKLMRYIDLKAR